MKRLRVIAPGPEVFAALRDALAGGDAILVSSSAGVPTAGAPTAGGDIPQSVEQRIALVVETSGSTGRPKRVALSADALLANAAASESALGGPGQWVLALPTHYIAGLNVLARSLAAQTEPVRVEGERFTASGFLAAVDRMSLPERFTALVPAQLATLLDDPASSRALAGFSAVLVGGQATPGPLRERASAAGIRVRRSYGSSETSGGCVYDGVPIGTTVVKVVDGEIWIGGPSLAEGYLGDPGLTAERFADDGGARWFRTADGGAFAGGVLTVTGRRDDVLISGGVKVALAAVERVLREQPGLHDVVVVAVPDERWGEVPVAVTASTDVDQDAATAAVVAELGRPARPARVLTVRALPLLPSGKVDRLAVRALAVADGRPSGTG
ncbi:MAG TPA: AMP-binding protein [Pseudolysinimonas sp.]|nr:AMP-binding protein [Pseudolysinimonas sp.]